MSQGAQVFELSSRIVRPSGTGAGVFREAVGDDAFELVRSVLSCGRYRWCLSLMIDESTDIAVSPLNGAVPVAISWRTTPSEKMSDRSSTTRPSACSGDMYATVPTTGHAPLRLPSWSRRSVPGLELRDAEVQHLDSTLVRHHDVGRLDVTMHDTLLVRSADGVGQLDGPVEEAGPREPVPRDVAHERLSVDHLHREEVQLVGLFDRVDGHDVRVVERGDRTGFTLEAAAAIGVGGKLRRQDLQCHTPAEFRVFGEVDLTHTAAAERARIR